MLPMAFTAATGVSRRCKSRDFRVPTGETSLPSTWLGAGQGMGAADEWEALCLLGPQKGMLLVLEDTNFYCRVSTKASNSRTFFSCTASFSGSESYTRRGEKSCLFQEGTEASQG